MMSVSRMQRFLIVDPGSDHVHLLYVSVAIGKSVAYGPAQVTSSDG